jgi:hypothetical protein
MDVTFTRLLYRSGRYRSPQIDVHAGGPGLHAAGRRIEDAMKHKIILVLFLSFATSAVWAVTPGTCSVATLKGTFGVLEQGIMIAQLPGFPAPPFPISNSALATYDGAGSFSGTFTASDNGVVSQGTFSGTYTVDANCGYSDEFTIQPMNMPGHHAGAIRGQGLQQEIDFIYTDPTLAAYGTAKRTPPEGCSNATIKGTYIESLQGTVVGTPPLPAVMTGIAKWDGAGSFTGTFVSTLGAGAGEGSYAVNADCTYTSIVTSGDGAGTTSVGTITGRGTFQEVTEMFTVPWLVATGTFKRQGPP